MSYKVFISSAYKDTDLARDLGERLKKAGVEVLTQTVQSGDDVVTKVSSNLRKADEVVVILTHNSIDSKSLLFEMGAATSLDKHLTPIVQGVESGQLPTIIKQMKYVKYADLEGYISNLKHRANMSTEAA